MGDLDLDVIIQKLFEQAELLATGVNPARFGRVFGQVAGDAEVSAADSKDQPRAFDRPAVQSVGHP